MKRSYIIIFLIGIYSTLLRAQVVNPCNKLNKYETRAVWLTTLNGLDWPKQRVSSTQGRKAQQAELCHILDRLKAININTVLLQVRTRGMVIYPSGIEPFDGCLTGEVGKHPGYDPLAFAIEECHKRGMELHAWLVTIPIYKINDAKKMGKRSLTRQHPELCVKHNGMWYLDPAQPGSVQYLNAICSEIAQNYDVDGIHFDYIRYPENGASFNDQKSYRKYGRGKNKASWHRESLTQCVAQLYKNIKSIKPWIKVSSAPIGKHENLSRYPSYGWNAYQAVYQDVGAWLKEDFQDLIFPMMYFRDNHFFPFALHWKEIGNNHPIIPGLGIYFLSRNEKDWPLTDITRELHFTRDQKMGGQAFFRYQFLDENHKGLYDYLKYHFYTYPSLTQPIKGGEMPDAPQGVEMSLINNHYALHWKEDTAQAFQQGARYLRYNVYAVSRRGAINISQPQHLIATALDSCSIPIDLETCLYEGINFAVTAVNRYGKESKPHYLGMNPMQQTSYNQLDYHNNTIYIPALKSEYLVVVTLQGSIVKTVPICTKLNVADLPNGCYEVRTLEDRGKSRSVGFFIKTSYGGSPASASRYHS